MPNRVEQRDLLTGKHIAISPDEAADRLAIRERIVRTLRRSARCESSDGRNRMWSIIVGRLGHAAA
jgi:hypothetical protein